MKLIRFLTGQGDGIATVPDGQLLDISLVPDPTLGSWLSINQSGPIFVPPGTTFELGAHELGLCCGAERCDQYPGDVQITIAFGAGAIVNEPDLLGGPPLTWLVVYTGC